MKYPLWKRTFDIFGSVLGLVLLVPLFLPIALAIKLDSRGPVIVRLRRVSEEREIMVCKFRSMVRGAESKKQELFHLNERKDGPLFKMRHDPRVTRVGKFLRRFRLDEFPQLWNVLLGELALVGPRPREPQEAAAYPKEYALILKVRQGVTGLSQVRGASSLPFLKELALDKYYVEHMSLGLDLQIIGRTVAILFFDPTAV